MKDHLRTIRWLLRNPRCAWDVLTEAATPKPAIYIWLREQRG